MPSFNIFALMSFFNSLALFCLAAAIGDWFGCIITAGITFYCAAGVKNSKIIWKK